MLGDHFGAHGRPVGVGTQEHLATGLGLLQRRQQVGGEHAGLAGLGVELVVQVGVQAGRGLFADVLRIQPRLGRHDCQYQLYATLLQGVAHTADQREVFLFELIAVGDRLELLVTEQPVLAAQYHAWAAFVEQLEIQRRPQVGADALERELLVVVGLGGLGQLAVEGGHLRGALEAAQAAQRPQAQAQQQGEEQQGVEFA
ncbi:hypothetical protein D3C81_1526240 [compost metagenome]